ncbi:testis-expressed protein 33 isoform X1 [Alligator sinensis]|uniref:Testis-expressed protein 33 isoform X1 n=1 Tax=Alligator sinensis TaxID=38654 RepID=A0A3Q0GS71_ALLSI|nr:testis-expressed protein 33 isoform X1 [Alligator sinensis]
MIYFSQMDRSESIVPHIMLNTLLCFSLEEVPIALASHIPAAEKQESIQAGSPSEPGDANKEYIVAGVQPTNKRTSLRSSSRTSWKISKGPVAPGTPSISAPVKPMASPSVQHLWTRSYSKQSLRPKSPSAQTDDAGEEREETRDVSGTKEPAAGQHQRGRTGALQQLAQSSQREAEDAQTNSDVARQHRTLGPRIPGSPRKTIKSRYKETKEVQNGLSAKESLASIGQDVKAEGKPLPERKSSLIPPISKHNCGSTVVDHLIAAEQERRALCEAGLIEGQKRLSDRTLKLLENPLTSTGFADYNELGYNLRSNIFQGGPLESKSLMKDSYTPDVIQRAVRDPKHWHGRKTDELGRWHQKNALNINLQKALEQKYGEKNKGSKS